MRPLLYSPLFTFFWSIIGAVSIRTKVLGIILMVIILFGFGVTIQVGNLFEETLTLQLQERGISIARDVAARATDIILINDEFALNQLLIETQNNNMDVRYIFVLNPQNEVIAHTFGAGFPSQLIHINDTENDAHHTALWFNSDEGQIWDIAVPIFEGHAGTARVGISLVGIQQVLAATVGQIMLMTIFVSAIGIGAATLLTWVLTRPILSLVSAVQAVEKGNFRIRVERWAGDEIGELSVAFNNMIMALAEAEKLKAEREMLHRQYVKGVINAQEDERKRIARDLHDGIGQALTSLLVGFRTIEEVYEVQQTGQHLSNLRSLASTTLQDVHNMALDLRPSVLDEFGLQAALEHYINDCRNRYVFAIDLIIHGLEGIRLSVDMETALYRITQESVTNIARHANAETAGIILERRNQHLVMIIEDDGCGFDPSRVSPTRLGIYGMRERIELLNGIFTIDSKAGTGTTLFVNIPLHLQSTDRATGKVAPVPMVKEGDNYAYFDCR